MPPFFSIAVTTYDRVEMLADTVRSVLGQSFGDFEVVIGNDNPARTVDDDLLGLSDPRIRYVNHPQNLGEYDNMNRLLELSTGRYFTWLADDDLFREDYLEKLHRALVESDYPARIYARYADFFGDEKPSLVAQDDYAMEPVSGRDFVRRAFQAELKVIGSMGFFEREALTTAGGLPEGSPSAGGRVVFSEYLLLLFAGRDATVPVLDSPVIWFRHHPDSFSCRATLVDAYEAAGQRLVEMARDELTTPALLPDLATNLTAIMVLSLESLGQVAMRSGVHRGGALLCYISERPYAEAWHDTPHAAVATASFAEALTGVSARLEPLARKEMIRHYTPSWLYGLARQLRRRFRPAADDRRYE